MNEDLEPNPFEPLVQHIEEVRLLALQASLLTLKAVPVERRQRVAKSMRMVARKKRRRGKPMEADTLLWMARQVIKLRP